MRQQAAFVLREFDGLSAKARVEPYASDPILRSNSNEGEDAHAYVNGQLGIKHTLLLTSGKVR